MPNSAVSASELEEGSVTAPACMAQASDSVWDHRWVIGAGSEATVTVLRLVSAQAITADMVAVIGADMVATARHTRSIETRIQFMVEVTAIADVVSITFFEL